MAFEHLNISKLTFQFNLFGFYLQQHSFHCIQICFIPNPMSHFHLFKFLLVTWGWEN